MNLAAVIFDFNGVLLDDEPLHMRAFATLLAEEGLTLTSDAYFTHYLGLDDKHCIAAACRDLGGWNPEGERLRAFVERKAVHYRREIEGSVRIYPGAAELLREVAAEYPVAINSGARHAEIAFVLEATGLARHVRLFVSADEVACGKPNPEGFLLTHARLRAEVAGLEHLLPGNCLVIEDAPNGVRAAHAAGMSCVAVASSRAEDGLREAEFVAPTIADLQLADLRRAHALHSPLSETSR